MPPQRVNTQPTFSIPRCRTFRIGDRLQPSALFNQLPLLLTDRVSLVPRGMSVDGAAPTPLRVLRHVRCHLHVPAFAHEISGVIRLVRTDRDSMHARNLFQHQHCCMTLGGASGREDFRRDDESVAVLCQQVPVVAQLGLTFPLPLRARRASGSVVDPWVSLLRFSPWKSTVGLPGSSGGVFFPSFR